jgi:hypothetical protein
MTTIASAQDWNADSRTRIDMSGENEKMQTSQRATIGATWGGSDWGIHVSTDVNYMLGDDTEGTLTAKVYEAYASTDVMGYANVTVGRQALDYGSGAIISSNQWGATRSTWDGFKVDLGLEMADVTIGYANSNDGAHSVDATTGVVTGMQDHRNQMYANIGKADGDYSVNLLVVRSGVEMGDVEMMNSTSMGLDVSYALMGGDLSLDASYNTGTYESLGLDATTGLATMIAAEDMDMLSIGASYSINENFSASLNQTTYGDGGFSAVGGADMNGSYGVTGNLGYLNANDQNRNIGVNYAMGDFTVGAKMHMITTTNDDDALTLLVDESDYERNVTEFKLGYKMTDNANLSIMYASDEVNDNDADKYMYLTLNIGM